MLVRLALLLSALALACVHATGDTHYGKSAEEDYRSGSDELRVHNYVEAARYFERVRTKYPFSQYAALAELRLADLKFAQDRNIEAADAYQQFVKLHPNHEQADYASYRAGLSYWKETPGDFVLFPPAYEKDQAQARDATKALAAFLDKYPQSKYRPEAEQTLAKARQRLADHEWYAAEFYAKRGHPAGAAGRLETLVRDYPTSPRAPEALYRLARTYLDMDEKFRAQQALQQLIAKHPQDPHRPDAEKLLASLR
jgi:outer membrane protein assembly factor BamD